MSLSDIDTSFSRAKTSNNNLNNNTKNQLAQLYPHVSEDTPLPSKWNGKEKSTTLTLSHNSLVVQYKGWKFYGGPGKSHKDAASVRSDYPIPPLCGIYYYEVKILSKGRDGYMGIGLSTSEVNLNRLPGWDKGSYGYHGDDGHSFCSSGSGIVYGPTFTTGDFVGCCVNFLDNTCFYTRNGYNLGTSFKDIPTEIYPTVGLQTPNEAVEANFGLMPFKFDIEKYMDEYREKTRQSIINFSLKEGELIHQLQLRRIVSTYLVHYGYCATAEQFTKNVENVFEEELASMRNRQLIQQLILEGRTTDAIEKIRELFPNLLNNTNLLFILKARQFIEMVNGTESEIRTIRKPSTTNTNSTCNSFTPHTTTSNSFLSSSSLPQQSHSFHNRQQRANSPVCLSPSSSTKNSCCCQHSSSPIRPSSPMHTTISSTIPKNSFNNNRSRSNSPYTTRQHTKEIGANEAKSLQRTENITDQIPVVSTVEEASNSEAQQQLTTASCLTESSISQPQTHQTSADNTTVNSTTVANLMDIDDLPATATNGFSTRTVPTTMSNGLNHSLLGDEHMDNTNQNNGYTGGGQNDDEDDDVYDSCQTHMDLNATNHTSETKHSPDDDLLYRILQFGRELYTLKQQLTTEYGENLAHDKILQDAFSLLAYSDPKHSPMGYLLDPSQREPVSTTLNSAILEAHNMPRHPALEVLVGYLQECDKTMHKNNIPDCAFIDLNKYLRP
ncbi:unnamed protein product [Didymodactylos carnosus]|uniref:Ran-binding protein 9 n=1 Tax=Didymodactylos carnosus TaxID=1234261 RepID=A0A813ZNQ1_9BILA|nr:unnamed protein product [Didymodactylos carnosus]CAF0901064.1 unnamed protein product [Didymodactylos carnosus]CAF3521016.1 unnamed protein product [Didymodactylos carnosus]CAF3683553.1 unnamed protein product [Didymodactylos carnosus]